MDSDAERVAAAVLAHPAVVQLSGGPFGTVASYLPGLRLLGVRLPPAPGAAVEIALVARIGVPLPRLADEVAAAVQVVLGPVPVDVTVTDVVPGRPATAVRGARAPLT